MHLAGVVQPAVVHADRLREGPAIVLASEDASHCTTSSMWQRQLERCDHLIAIVQLYN